MAATLKFVLLALATLVVVSAAPAKKSTIADLIATVEEYAPLFEELSQEKDDLLQFARTGLFATFRNMNEAILMNLGKTRNAIEYGFDETRTSIAEKMLMGGDEECLLELVSEIRDEQRGLAAGMSICSSVSTEVKDDLSYSFYEILELLQRLSTALSEYVLWSFSTHNSIDEPQEHADYLRRTYEESVRMWEKEVLPLIQFQLDAMEYNRPIIVAENLSCLDKMVEKVEEFNEYILGKMATCYVPLKV